MSSHWFQSHLGDCLEFMFYHFLCGMSGKWSKWQFSHYLSRKFWFLSGCKFAYKKHCNWSGAIMTELLSQSDPGRAHSFTVMTNNTSQFTTSVPPSSPQPRPNWFRASFPLSATLGETQTHISVRLLWTPVSLSPLLCSPTRWLMVWCWWLLYLAHHFPVNQARKDHHFNGGGGRLNRIKSQQRQHSNSCSICSYWELYFISGLVWVCVELGYVNSPSIVAVNVMKTLS